MAQAPRKAVLPLSKNVCELSIGRLSSWCNRCSQSRNDDACKGRRRRAATFFMLLPANPYYPSLAKPLADDCAPKYTQHVHRRSTAIGEAYFRTSLVWPLAPYQGSATDKVADTTQSTSKSRQPFRRRYAPRHHPSAHKRVLTALQGTSPSRQSASAVLAASFYLGHTPRLELLNC